uniref:Uncharacterized protein n=1 Tax=Plectus sambesii TaxID=2011161 RepID=A0A914VSG1_9BILA
MSLSADVPKEMDQTEQERGLGEMAREAGEMAKEAFSNAAEKTKEFMLQMKEKVTGEEEKQIDRDQAIREAGEQKQRLDCLLLESACTPPNPELANCHLACACPECAYVRKPMQQPIL